MRAVRALSEFLLDVVDNRLDARLDALAGRIDHQLGALRLLVRSRDAGEIRDLAAPRLLVEAFGARSARI